MFVVGLTGGIGSGKSSVAALFAAKGVPIIDTDILARDVTQPGEAGLKGLVDIFGTGILQMDGTLDRTRLRKIVFADAVKRDQVENLLHPLIRTRMRARIDSLRDPYCIAVIPLLMETAPNPLIKRILAVDTSRELQISRTMARDKTTKAEVNAILDTQVSREQRLRLADDIIVNDGDYEDLIPRVDELHELYLKLAED